MKGKKTDKEKIGQLVQGLKGKTTYVVTGMNSIILRIYHLNSRRRSNI